MLKVSRIFHAGYIFEYNNKRIVFDPILENPFSVNCYVYPSVKIDLSQLPKADAIFISHYHDDHCSLTSLQYFDKDTPIYIYCVHQDLLDWIRDLGFKYVYSLQLNHSIQVADFLVVPHKALDEFVDAIFEIQIGGLKILNVVDAIIDDDSFENLSGKAPWDLVLWPYQILREVEVLSPSRYLNDKPQLPKEWFNWLHALEPKFVIASSCQFIHEEWSWYKYFYFSFSYKQFFDALSLYLPQVQGIKLDPGSSIFLAKGTIESAPPLLCVQRTDQAEYEYSFKPNKQIPALKEMASYFSILKTEEERLVDEYLNTTMTKHIKDLGPSNELYFNIKRIWKLSVYVTADRKKEYFFELNENHIVPLLHAPTTWEWHTEILATKLLGAIQNGETLSSLYLRINDELYTEEIEERLKDVNVLEDPLLRALYHNQFCTYQKVQLIKSKHKML